MESAKSRATLARLKTDLAIRKSKQQWNVEVNKKVSYPNYSFYKGILQISDRRIPLNGPIIRGVADYITKRINYYNNKSDSSPIFLVINVFPGGFVMEGYQIVKTYRSKQCPSLCSC